MSQAGGTARAGDPPRVAAIVLAAGESRRMGYPKALLPIDSQTFAERVIGALAAAGVETILVVLGAHAERIQAAAQLAPARVVLNPDWPSGQLSSLQAGLRALAPGQFDAVLMALVDHPLIDPAVVRAVIEAFAATDRPVVVPVHAGRRGHPVLFATRLIPELLGAPLNEGARAVVRAHAAEVLEVPAAAPGILADIDTPHLYAEWVGPGCPPAGEAAGPSAAP